MRTSAGIKLSFSNIEELNTLYKEKIGGYPKFHKMDALSKLGFIATELLLNKEIETCPDATQRFVPRENRAIILVGKNASIVADKDFQKDIEDADNFFPSPSIFVYTLPNIVTGEIAIRNKYYGESEFYIIDQKDEDEINRLIRMAFLDSQTTSIIGGWIDCENENKLECELNIYTK